MVRANFMMTEKDLDGFYLIMALVECMLIIHFILVDLFYQFVITHYSYVNQKDICANGFRKLFQGEKVEFGMFCCKRTNINSLI